MGDSELVQKVKLRKVNSLVCKENKGCNTTVYAKGKVSLKYFPHKLKKDIEQLLLFWLI